MGSFKRLITLTVITLSELHCLIRQGQIATHRLIFEALGQSLGKSLDRPNYHQLRITKNLDLVQ